MCKYGEKIKALFDGPIKEIVNNIDFPLFDEEDNLILYYLFPFIERLCIECLSLLGDVNVENKKQGKIRTLSSLLNIEDMSKLLEKDDIEFLKNMYGQEGLRNILLHYHPNCNEISIKLADIRKLKCITINLIEKYNSICNTYENKKISLIPLIQ
ncbi:DUF4209 domain-containing protein [Faecalitalea cylindroides]|uniref:DUF4209 domain-containing protein n=1 Tax=Faecalitalea cylindroides TaxID=39483 RepID=UPI0039919B6C